MVRATLRGRAAVSDRAVGSRSILRLRSSPAFLLFLVRAFSRLRRVLRLSYSRARGCVISKICVTIKTVPICHKLYQARGTEARRHGGTRTGRLLVSCLLVWCLLVPCLLVWFSGGSAAQVQRRPRVAAVLRGQVNQLKNGSIW